MTTQDREDAVLIRYVDVNEDTIIRSLHSVNPSEILKLAYYAKKFELPFEISYNYDNEHDKYNKKSGFVYEIDLGTGGHDSLPYVDIYLDLY